MIVIGGDLAANSGYAVRDSEKHRSTIECGVISVDEYEWEARYAIFAIQWLDLMRKYSPDFVALEAPEHGVRQFAKKEKTDLAGNDSGLTINPGALQLTGIVSAAVTCCTLLSIPWGIVYPITWRGAYYGKDFVPPRKMVRDAKTGRMRDEGPDWKQAAIDAAEREGIRLPSTKKDKKDAAEAIGVGTCWHKAKIPEIKWIQDKFVDLRTGAYRKKEHAA